MQDFRKLRIWQRSHRLTLEVYRVTTDFPRYEVFGVTSQVRKSTASIPANIAEGSGRGSNREFAQFIRNSIGSANESEYWMLLSHDLKYMDDASYATLTKELIEIRQMAWHFHDRLTHPQSDGSPITEN